VEVSCVVK
jgi:hypothetical protein